MRIRIRFSKTGDLRFIGPRDLMDAFHRILRRAGIRPAYSQGFHPKPKVSFPVPLTLCVEGENELLEIELPEDAENVSPESIAKAVRQLADNNRLAQCRANCATAAKELTWENEEKVLAEVYL